MYAHATVNHQPLPELSADGTAKVYGNDETGVVHVHLPDLYLSFPHEEAERLALALLHAAAVASRVNLIADAPLGERKRWVAEPVPFNPDDITMEQ